MLGCGMCVLVYSSASLDVYMSKVKFIVVVLLDCVSVRVSVYVCGCVCV